MKEWVAEFDRRRRTIVDRLNKISGVSCLLPQGAFYVFPNFSKLYGKKTPSGKVLDGSSSLAAYLLEDHKVASVPGIAFGADDFQRLSYAMTEPILWAMRKLGRCASKAARKGTFSICRVCSAIPFLFLT